MCVPSAGLASAGSGLAAAHGELWMPYSRDLLSFRADWPEWPQTCPWPASWSVSHMAPVPMEACSGSQLKPLAIPNPACQIQTAADQLLTTRLWRLTWAESKSPLTFLILNHLYALKGATQSFCHWRWTNKRSKKKKTPTKHLGFKAKKWRDKTLFFITQE